jgi:CspA family cold shock protein
MAPAHAAVRRFRWRDGGGEPIYRPSRFPFGAACPSSSARGAKPHADQQDLFPRLRPLIRHAIVARRPRAHGNTITMQSGTVKWFNATKAYGFIQPDDGSKDVFVHISEVQRAGMQGLNDGQKLRYELQQGQQGKSSAVLLQSA